MSQGLAAYAVHAVTTPAARGRGVFSTLELHNEQEAACAGADVGARASPIPMAGPILVGKLGWEDVTSLRIWVRPKRLREDGARTPRRHARACRRSRSVTRHRSPAHHIVRDAEYLSWRYADSPRPYVRFESDDGWAVVTHAVWHGYSSAVVCDAVGSDKARRCFAVASGRSTRTSPSRW